MHERESISLLTFLAVHYHAKGVSLASYKLSLPSVLIENPGEITNII